MKNILDDVGALINATCTIAGSSSGSLQGRSFVLKDIFDVKGFKTGFGNPAWRNTHPLATLTNSSVEHLLLAGASLQGKSHCDELTYNLFGNNFHYGTPINSASPLRMTGGSSSGSAAAVCADLVDFSIGSDTGGSVRAPASFCGLFGIRPTHGSISLDNSCGLAPSFDTLGWFAKDASLLRLIGTLLLTHVNNTPPSYLSSPKLVYLKEAFDVIDPEIADLLHQQFARFGGFTEVSLGNESLVEWADQFRILQGAEVWKNLGTWVSQHWEDVSPTIRARFEMASQLSVEQQTQAQKRWSEIKAKMDDLLQNNAVLVLPTVAGIAPLLNAPNGELEIYRKQCFQLLCISGLSGTPQINLPICKHAGAPLGISILGARCSDLQLLQIAEDLFKQ
jgi:amidase